MSLRARVLAGLVVIAVVIAVAGTAVTRLTERHLVDQVDSQLRAGSPGRFFDPGPDPRRAPDDAFPVSACGRNDRPSAIYVAFVVADSGELCVLSYANITTEKGAPDLDLDTLASHRAEPFTTSGSNGEEYRVLVVDDPRGVGQFVSALPLSGVDDAISRLLRIELVAGLAVLLTLGLVGWWVIRLGVRPVKAMTAAAGRIAAGDLSHRVPESSRRTEAGELGVSLNVMLTTIESAFEERERSQDRLRQFVADASHELRTPVTTIRGYAELYRKGALSDSDRLDDAMRRTEAEAVRMGDLVEDMLTLARSDQGRPFESTEIDLDRIVADVVADARATDPGRAITDRIDAGLRVIGDDHRLRQVVGNLVTNARVHTDPASPIEVVLERRDGVAHLVVRDHGPGMEADDAERAFERFFRADPARARHRGGSGLGLAIVHTVVSAHGGTVALNSSVAAGTTVTVELPLA